MSESPSLPKKSVAIEKPALRSSGSLDDLLAEEKDNIFTPCLTRSVLLTLDSPVTKSVDVLPSSQSCGFGLDKLSLDKPRLGSSGSKSLGSSKSASFEFPARKQLVDNGPNDLFGQVFGPEQPIPEYVEKTRVGTTFSSAREAIEKIHAVCLQLENTTDCTVMAPSFAMRCVSYCGSAQLRFEVNVYRSELDHAPYLVEVQRRFGCSMSFSRTWSQLLQLLADFTVNPPKVRVAQLPVAPVLAPVAVAASASASVDEPAEEAFAEMLINLLDMALCGFADVRNNALCSLAEATKHADSELLRSWMASDNNAKHMTDALTRALLSRDGESCRLAMTVCAELVKQKQLRPVVVNILLDHLVDVLNSDCTETLRQSARGLDLLSETHAADLSKLPDIRLLLLKHACSTDTRLRSHAVTALKRVF